MNGTFTTLDISNLFNRRRDHIWMRKMFRVCFVVLKPHMRPFSSGYSIFLGNVLRAYRVGVGVNLDLIFPPPFYHIHVRVRCSCTDMIVAIRCDTCTSKCRVFANIQWYIQRAAYRYDQSHASKRVQYRTVAINVFFPGFKYKKILSHPA
jgi:hypothetical protein